MDTELNLKNLAGIESFSSRFARLGDLYILSNIDSNRLQLSQDDTFNADNMAINNKPLRLNGMLFLLVSKGNIKFQVNTETYETDSDDIIVIRPGTLIKFTEVSKDVVFTMLFISTTFLNSINIDLNNIAVRPLFTRPRTVLQLSKDEKDVIRKYFELLNSNANDKMDSVFATRIARTLISAIVYELLRITETRTISEKDIVHNDGPQGRAHNYVSRFMQLLYVHYAQQRNLDFYAQQLCITSKYLSMVTKQITGRTASEWMNHVIILEAKNMLRFSDKSIQQIAYALNFPSQSAFGKYFKRLTGQSPKEYLKSAI